jgi:hypothetical protein
MQILYMNSFSHDYSDGKKDELIFIIIKIYEILQVLNLADCTNITDTSIIQIAEKCHNLKELDISECPITDLSLMKIAECCPNIESLATMDCLDITDSGLIRYFLVTYLHICYIL